MPVGCTAAVAKQQITLGEADPSPFLEPSLSHILTHTRRTKTKQSLHFPNPYDAASAVSDPESKTKRTLPAPAVEAGAGVTCFSSVGSAENTIRIQWFERLTRIVQKTLSVHLSATTCSG